MLRPGAAVQRRPRGAADLDPAVLLLFLSSGGTGAAPLFVPGRDPREYADTLPQALILTAIVIGFAVIAFLTAMIYRSWLLIREDEVEVDAEDVKIARMPAWDAEDDAELVEALTFSRTIASA